MEMLEDNIIETKLNSLDTLPEGYTPNLESKWSMLEAGLEGNTKRIIAWKPIAAAAALLLLGGGVLLLQQIKPQPKGSVGQLKASVTVPQTVVKTITPLPQKTTVMLKSRSIKPQTKQSHFVVTIPEVPATVWEVTLPAVIEPPQENQVFANTPISTVKKQQFVEIDFNDVPIVKQQDMEPSIAFKPFTFGLEQTAYTKNDGEHQHVFRIQKSF